MSHLGTVPVTDPTGPGTNPYRVYRSGSWITLAQGCRSANRANSSSGYRYISIGFRLARPPG